MLQLLVCAFILILLLLLFVIWGHSISKWFSIEVSHLPMQILVGFFAFFIVMEIIILPVIFLRNNLQLATYLCIGIIIIITAIMLYKHKLAFFDQIKQMKFSIWLIVSIIMLALAVLVSVLQQYKGYDTTYYIGEMASFVYYGEFWTRDAFGGMAATPTIPLHYALSCFYPLFAILAYIFSVDARLVVMYSVRALCVILFGCTAFSWGYELFEREKKNGYIFTVICLILCAFLMDNHSSAFMMMVRGYESKGYCAAVVAPMCTLALVKLCKDTDDKSNWHLLGLVAWSSMPIAMSSMAIVPVAIGVVGISMMIYHRRMKGILGRCIICALPNIVLMTWYVLGTYLPIIRG